MLFRRTTSVKLSPSSLARLFSKNSQGEERKLIKVSDFIHDSLYAKNEGYFCKPKTQLGFMKDPIPFADIFGYEDYQKLLRERYPKNAWLTPSEIFKPYYGMAIANYIDYQVKMYQDKAAMFRNAPVKIIEVGAGNGSAAVSILNYYKLYRPRSYKTINYTIVEISDSLIQKCKEQIQQTHPLLLNPTKPQVTFVNSSILDYKQNTPELTFVLLLEVLDNLPHDRLYFDKRSGKLEQAYVDITDPEKPKEVRTSKVDPEVIELYEMWKQIESVREKAELNDKWEVMVMRFYKFMKRIENQDNVFLPTHCYKMLKLLNSMLPNAHFIFSDFDLLRESRSSLIGHLAPTVSTKLEQSEDKKDYKDYLVPRGSADIFFPTDFKLLKMMHSKVTQKNCQIMKTFEFVEEYSEREWATTKSYYNPLKEDFYNTSFFLSK